MGDRRNIRVEMNGQTGVIVIDRPERFNSLDVETARDLRKAGIQLARDPAVRCAVIRGSHEVFCSGADLKYVQSGGEARDFSYLREGVGDQAGFGEAFKEILEYIHATISEIRRAPKPFIAAVEGVAAAGGFGLAMACDLVYAAEGARFEWSYSNTGLTGAESSTFLLPRLVGLRRALEMMLLNPRLDAMQAKAAGLVNDVFPQPEFDRSVAAITERLAHGPTEAYGIAKALLNRAAGIDRLDVHLDEELENLARIAGGRNFAEGLDAFLSKRTPLFKDK